jgi:hypothetical protein
MSLPLLHGLWTPVTVLVFVFLVHPRANPFAALARTLRLVVTTPAGRLVFGSLALVLVVNVVECLIDPALSAWLGYDLTARVALPLDDAIGWLQVRLPHALIVLLSWFYFSAYIAALLAPFVVWVAQRRYAAIRDWTAGFVANYVLALPFYLLVPVQESGWSGIARVRPLIETVWPGISDDMRWGSALDNCFPSLHVSCMLTLLLIARRHGPAGVRGLAWVMALLTPVAVMVLGIHWMLDVVAAVPFALVCVAVGVPLGRRVEASLPALSAGREPELGRTV